MNRLFQDDQLWTKVNDGNEAAFDIFSRHYSFRTWRRRNGHNGKRMVGPGESIVLLSKDGSALLIWKKQKFSQDGQIGINCAVFRNEGKILSSVLLEAAETIALKRWPAERLFTYVNPRKIKSVNPGYCFKMNGWKQCGETKMRKLVILHKP